MTEPFERSGVARWAVSFGAVLAAHAVLAWSVMHLQPEEGLPAGEPVLLQLEPPAAPQQADASETPPGPEETKTAEIERDAPEVPEQTPEKEPEPEPEPDQVAEVPAEPQKEPEKEAEKEVARVEPEPDPIPPAPQEVTPDVAVPLPEPKKPEKKVEEKVEKKVEKRKPKPKPRPERDENRQPAAQQRQAALASARSGAASNDAALATWRAVLSAHLQRHKRSIDSSQGGRASLTFTVDRNGRVLSSSVGSSGVPALDQEVRDLIRRAQPLPAAPAGVAVERQAFTVPFSFGSR